MNQLRLDPLTGRWVVVSTDRASRPQAFAPRVASIQADTSRPCPFCPGNEESVTPTLETRGPDGQWLVRVLPNLYPAFEGTAPFVVTNRGPVFTQATAGGIHEVFVLSPDHQNSWSMLSDAQTTAVMTAVRDRIEEHSSIPGLRYSQAVVNSGREAGASLEHPHGQLLSMPFVPGEIADELAGFARFQGNCLLCAVLDAEEEAKHRLVYADDRVAISVIQETGTSASGDAFDNTAIYVSRLRPDGTCDRLTTVDLDAEHCVEFWQRNPGVPSKDFS